jgi:phage-related protein
MPIFDPNWALWYSGLPYESAFLQDGGQSTLDDFISCMIYFHMGYKVKLLPPAVRFLDGLHDRLKAKVARSIRLLQEFGPSLREPHSKKVSDWPGLFELRIMLGHDACRFFYFWHHEHLYIVTSGYIKKRMKLDRKELERAALLMRQHTEGTGGTE